MGGAGGNREGRCERGGGAVDGEGGGDDREGERSEGGGAGLFIRNLVLIAFLCVVEEKC